MSDERRRSRVGASSVLLAFLLGGLTGAALALLYAPRSGRETRDMLERAACARRPSAGGSCGTDAAAGPGPGGRGAGYVERQKRDLEQRKERFAAAVEAGRQAYREEKQRRRRPSPGRRRALAGRAAGPSRGDGFAGLIFLGVIAFCLPRPGRVPGGAGAWAACAWPAAWSEIQKTSSARSSPRSTTCPARAQPRLGLAELATRAGPSGWRPLVSDTVDASEDAARTVRGRPSPAARLAPGRGRPGQGLQARAWSLPAPGRACVRQRQGAPAGATPGDEHLFILRRLRPRSPRAIRRSARSPSRDSMIRAQRPARGRRAGSPSKPDVSTRTWLSPAPQTTRPPCRDSTRRHLRPGHQRRSRQLA